MYAIIEDSGTQYRVEQGETLNIDLRDAALGTSVTFDRVLLVADEKGVRVGKPLVQGAKVTAEVIGEEHGPKLEIFKLRRRKSSRRHTGHRQAYLKVRVTAIEAIEV
ncbi:MAG: 50S ribosomal protein L21 [Planctomycetes bacterium]|nr:50S ribosomal protein L21 [Planctomycetota bacterium]